MKNDTNISLLNKLSFKRFDNPQDVESWVNEHYSQDQLDEFDSVKQLGSPISLYKGEFYKKMNLLLEEEMAEEDTFLGPAILQLNKQIREHEIPENICVSRYVPKKEFLKLLISTLFGEEMTYSSFLSTTLLPKYFSMDEIKKGRLLIELYIPEGTPGMYLPEVNPDSPEYEILLPYGLKLRRIKAKEYLIIA